VVFGFSNAAAGKTRSIVSFRQTLGGARQQLRRGRSDLQARDPSEHRPVITFRGLGFAPLARPIRRRGEGVQADHRERNQVSRAPARRWKGVLRFLLRNDGGELFGVYARNAQTALSAAPLRAEAHYTDNPFRGVDFFETEEDELPVRV
jgi:hypothetical protein